MSGDEKMREAVAQRVWEAAGQRNVTHAWIVGATLDALEPLTLKTGDGHLVKVDAFAGWDVNSKGEGPVEIFYRIVEAPDA